MHMKFFTFSDGDQVRVVHTSSNLSDAQLKRHQNLLSVTGDQALYDNYVGFWNRMNVGSWTYDGVEWKGEDRAPLGDAPGLKSYFFPRTEADPVRGTLELLECQDGADRVWASASLFHTDERLPVLKVLDDLESSGCDVRVIVALAEHKEWIDVNSDLDNVRVLDGAGEVWHSHHNKLIVTDALYQGEERHAVYAGSHNLNTGSLRLSSDGMLRVADEAVFNLYADYYEEMYALAG